MNNLTIRQIEDASSLANFHCGIHAMDEFIHSSLNDSIRNHYCNSYSVYLGSELVAMFALSFDSLELDSDSLEEMAEGINIANKPDLSKNYVDTFLSKHHYPALEIAYLAVEEKHAQKVLGELLSMLSPTWLNGRRPQDVCFLP